MRWRRPETFSPKAMGPGSIQSMKPYQHPNDYLDAITEVVNQRDLARG
jgi:hypothetical protein